MTVEHADVAYHFGNKSELLPDTRPGDFLLHHSHAFHSWLIRFGEGLRFRGKDHTFAFWNHASFVIQPGLLVEALGSGIVLSPIEKYAGATFARVRVKWETIDADEAVDFARQQIGAEYGFVTLIGVTLHMLTGGTLTFGIDGTQICSGLVARCLERGRTVFEHHDPSNIVPADLARHFQVKSPPLLHRSCCVRL